MAKKRQRSMSTFHVDGLPTLQIDVDDGGSAGGFLDQEDASSFEHGLQDCESDMATVTSSFSALNGDMSLKRSHSLACGFKRRAIVWFRRDMRLHDNLALTAAMRAQEQLYRTNNEEMALLPIYILHRPRHKRCGAVRFQFLLEAVSDLGNSIAKLQGRLLVLRGESEDVLRVVMAAWGVTDLFFESSVMPYAVDRDTRVCAIAESLDVKVTKIRGGTLFDPLEIIRLNGGQTPTEFERLLEITNKMPQPAQPIPPPVELKHAASFSIEQLTQWLQDSCYHDRCVADAIAGIGEGEADLRPFRVPSLTAFGLTPPDPHTPFVGGESEALKRLDAFCEDERRVGLFEKPKTSPVAVEAPSTTSLSAYLTFGCLSAREFFYRIMFIQLQFPHRPGFPVQVTLEGQLMWREFFYCYACGTPNFDSLKRNRGCKQIQWRLLNDEDAKGDSRIVEPDDVLAERQLQCWKDGRTGFPWIDAVMRQINQEGWTHHAGRHAAACFLTRGMLYISWSRGASYFQEKMIDMDWPINIGNWLWVSASCFFTNYRRVASPSTFPQRWDPQGQFIRKYIPALRNMPDKFVYEPWKAPLKVQRDAGCLIGKDYPFPIVDSKLAMTRCLAGMSLAFSDTEHVIATNTRIEADEGEAGFCTDDMCYSYRDAASIVQV